MNIDCVDEEDFMLLDDEVQSESISFCPIHFKPNFVDTKFSLTMFFISDESHYLMLLPIS